MRNASYLHQEASVEARLNSKLYTNANFHLSLNAAKTRHVFLFACDVKSELLPWLPRNRQEELNTRRSFQHFICARQRLNDV